MRPIVSKAELGGSVEGRRFDEIGYSSDHFYFNKVDKVKYYKWSNVFEINNEKKWA